MTPDISHLVLSHNTQLRLKPRLQLEITSTSGSMSFPQCRPSLFPGRRLLRRELPPVQHAGGPPVHGRRCRNSRRCPHRDPGQLRIPAGAAGAPVQPPCVRPQRGDRPGNDRLREAEDFQRELLRHLQSDRQVEKRRPHWLWAHFKMSSFNVNFSFGIFVRYLSHRVLPMESKKSRFALKRMAKRFGLIGAGKVFDACSYSQQTIIHLLFHNKQKAKEIICFRWSADVHQSVSSSQSAT